jgi:hypothetical protein
MINQRFTPNKEWYQERANPQFMGFTHLMSTLLDNFNDDEGKKMIEIGAYMGEIKVWYYKEYLYQGSRNNFGDLLEDITIG